MRLKIEKSAGGVVFKKEGNKTLWLITQHSKHKGWVFPKGLIGDTNKNEPMEEAAIREVKEEGGVKAEIVSKDRVTVQYFYKFQGKLVRKTVYYFLMKYISGDPKDHDAEMQDAKFVTEEEVKKTLTYKSDQQAFDKIKKLL